VTTNTLGNETVSIETIDINNHKTISTTIARGITNTVSETVAGSTVSKQEWTDPVSGECMWTEETRTTAWLSNGYRKESVVRNASDMTAPVTESETVYDFLGRVIAVTTPLGTTSNFYDETTGSLTKVSRTGMADTLYIYDELGEQTVTCLDVNGEGTVDYAGLDRITVNDTVYQEISNDWWRVSISAVYNETNSANVITTSISRVRMTGLGTDTFNGAKLTAQSEAEDLLGNVTRSSTYTDAANVTTWTVTDTPDSDTDAVQESIAGYPVQTVSTTSVTNRFSYDGFARIIETTEGVVRR
jgi:hypothetical protein